MKRTLKIQAYSFEGSLTLFLKYRIEIDNNALTLYTRLLTKPFSLYTPVKEGVYVA